MPEDRDSTHLFTSHNKTFLVAPLPMVVIRTILCLFNMLHPLVLLSAVSAQVFLKQRHNGRM